MLLEIYLQDLMLSVTGVSANPQGGYGWTVKHSASPSTLSMAKGATGTMTFTVAVQRSTTLKAIVSGTVSGVLACGDV